MLCRMWLELALPGALLYLTFLTYSGNLLRNRWRVNLESLKVSEPEDSTNCMWSNCLVIMIEKLSPREVEIFPGYRDNDRVACFLFVILSTFCDLALCPER